jgi:hypothetical protein
LRVFFLVELSFLLHDKTLQALVAILAIAWLIAGSKISRSPTEVCRIK